jgi:hypothetical protein
MNSEKVQAKIVKLYDLEDSRRQSIIQFSRATSRENFIIVKEAMNNKLVLRRTEFNPQTAFVQFVVEKEALGKVLLRLLWLLPIVIAHTYCEV